MPQCTDRALANGLTALVTSVLRHARRMVVLVIGTTLLLFGFILIAVPGPAFIVIPVGLAVLGLEFVWAHRLLRRVKTALQGGLGNGPSKRNL